MKHLKHINEARTNEELIQIVQELKNMSIERLDDFREYKEYVTDYVDNINEYDIDPTSDYFYALEKAYDELYMREDSPIYNFYHHNYHLNFVYRKHT